MTQDRAAAHKLQEQEATPARQEIEVTWTAKTTRDKGYRKPRAYMEANKEPVTAMG
jgi:hypothetical protein